MKYIYFLLIISLISCSTESSKDLPPPGEVILVEKTTDLGVVEKGIDAVPDNNGIFVQWYLLEDANIESYFVYRKAKNESFFSKIATIPVEGMISPFDTTFYYIDTDANLVLNNNEFIYYYYVTATNTDGIEGAKPDSLTQAGYMLLSKPITNVTQDITLNEQPVLSWSYPTSIPNFYIIRIENSWTEELIWTRQFQTHDFVWDMVVDLSTVSNPPVYQSGTMYRWRVDAVGPDPLFSGSESEWNSFRVQ